MESWEEEGSAFGSGSGAATDVELMRQAWRNEKAAPEMLGFEEALVRRLRDQIQLQVRVSYISISSSSFKDLELKLETDRKSARRS